MTTPQTTVDLVAKPRLSSGAPPRPSLAHVAFSFLGGLLAIAAVGSLTDVTGTPLVLGSFGATCVLVFGYPESPFSQPRHVIVGHVLSTTTGVVVAALLGYHWWSMALALALAIALMQLTRTVHPPAGSNPLIVMLGHQSWAFIVKPTLLGAVIVTLVALLFNNAVPARRGYPKYWY
ncbi:MAG TPA: HPP family protein [Polyangiaceae bacterium]|nr:HPP family protein [Polyangiaceae bacterium]